MTSSERRVWERRELAPIGGPEPSVVVRADGPLEYKELGSETRSFAALADAGASAESAAAYERGLRDGEQRVHESLRPALKALDGLIERLMAQAKRVEKEAESSLFSLSLAVAQKLFEREVTTDPTIVRELVARALQLLPMDPRLEIRLNPEDLAALEGERERVLPGGRAVDVYWVGDSALDRGSFEIETPHRMIDGRTDVALRNLYDRLGND